MKNSHKSFMAALLLCALAGTAHAQQTRACTQLGPVASSPMPGYSDSSGSVALVVGDHYWSCPCGESRKLVGDTERRNLVGANESRKLVGASESLQCRIDPGCGGFALLGGSISTVQVVSASGLRTANASCIVAY